MPVQPIRIPFPIKGLTTNLGYESGDIQTTRDCLNVAPDSAQESRVRGGSRTGVTKRYANPLDGTPRFANRVGGTDDGSPYEYLVIGVDNNVWIGESIPTSGSYPVGYNESLSSLSGILIAEGGVNDGDTIISEPDDAGPDGVLGTGDDIEQPLVTYDFSVNIPSNGISANYRNRVIVNSTGGYITGSKEFSDESGTVSYTGLQQRLFDVADWTTEGIDIDAHYVEVTQGTGQNITSGTYKISSVEQGYLVIEGAAVPSTASAGSETVTYSIREAVRDIDPSVPSITSLRPTGGYVPLDTTDVIAYRDRLVWASGRTWYMSRQGDAGDYDYSADPEDPARAVAGVNSSAGESGDPINAMALSGYDYLIFFCSSSVWVMRGDPAYGGQLYQSSSVAGCVGRNAWCYGRSTEIYFLGKDGLYMMEPNAGSIRSLSKSVLPRNLRGINADNYDMNLVYDPEDNCVLIFAVLKDGSAGENFIYDIDTGSFWPIRLQSNSHQPVFAETFGGSPSRTRRAVFVSNDGYIRDWYGSTDDGQPISSHVVFGPYATSEIDNIDGFLSELTSVVDEQSIPVTVEVYSGSSAEEAVSFAIAGDSPKYSATILSGRSVTHRPRVRGNSFCIRIVSSGSWAFESMSGMISPAGKTRR